MSVLIIAEHDNSVLKSATLNAVTAALALGAGDVDMLVAGSGSQPIADATASIPGIAKIRHAENA